MIRRPPRSPLFPSPTLFRSLDQLVIEPGGLEQHLPRRVEVVHSREDDHEVEQAADPNRPVTAPADKHEQLPQRSEEHTSELQSRQYLVCRILLDKKSRSTSR